MIIEFIGIRTKESFSPGQAKNSMLIEWTSQLSSVGLWLSIGNISRAVNAAKAWPASCVYNLYVVGGAVEVCEYKWRLIQRESRAVAAARFARAAENVQELVFIHKVYELGGFL